MIKISTLLSLYNKEKEHHLLGCLESLINQTYQADEIVIVFDGKIKKSLEDIVLKYQGNLPIKIIRLEENVGLGKALNEGLKHCSNEWIFRMDTDDICLPHRFEKQIEYIKKNPDIVLLGGQIEEFNETMEISLGIKSVPLEYDNILNMSYIRNPFNHMTVAYKKSVILEVGSYQHHLYMEDYNLWLRLLSKGYKAGNLADTLVNARTGMNMYTRRRGLDYIKSEYQLAILKKTLGLLSIPKTTLYFILRILPRILPKSLLGKIYRTLRKN